MHDRGDDGIGRYDNFVNAASLMFLKVFTKRSFVGLLSSRRYRLSILLGNIYTGIDIDKFFVWIDV